METKEWSGVADRSGWPQASGPWDGEPDKVQWPDQATGLPCLAVRHPSNGHWCGYVGVPPGHPWHQIEENQCTRQPPCGESWCDHAPGHFAQVHGGLTFAGSCDPKGPEGATICHLAGPGEPDDVWWLGFDCTHGGDWAPGMRRGTWFEGPDEYRTLAYVQSQCAGLALVIEMAGR